MRSVAQFTTTPQLENHRKRLAVILKIKPDSDVMHRTEEAIYRAYGLADLPGSSTNLEALKENLKSLESALQKIQGGFGKMQKTLKHMDNAHFIDDHYCLANEGDTYLLELASARGSGFSIAIEQMLNAVRDFEKESCVAAGKGRHTDTRFTNALIHLADFFAEEFPTMKVSCNKGARFYTFAAWFLSLHSGVKSPRRHIENAIQKRNSRA